MTRPDRHPETAAPEETPTARPAARKALMPMSDAPPEVSLKDLRSGVPDEDMDRLAATLSKRAGLSEPAAAPEDRAASAPPQVARIPPRRGNRPRCPLEPSLEMPYEGEEVDWTANLRADFPQYAFKQLREYAHKRGCTQVHAILTLMAQHVDDEGSPVFYIRPEELAGDRRKIPKKTRR